MNIVVPTLAIDFTAAIQQQPPTSMDEQIAQIFDTGGAASDVCGFTCANPDGTCAVAGDLKVDLCEVTTNNLIQQTLAPDLTMFSADGSTYMPSAGTDGVTMKDSVSVGFGFTAVGAHF
jgi:hypothetical protein